MTPYPDKDIMLFEKKDDTGAFLVAVNVRNAAHSMALPDAWKDMTAVDIYSGKDYTLKDKIDLPNNGTTQSLHSQPQPLRPA